MAKVFGVYCMQRKLQKVGRVVSAAYILHITQ